MTTSMNTLPDEILSEILSAIITVHDDDFSKANAPSPFGRSLVPSSDILLTSKRWLRVATPLLYECVVLRNTPQALYFYNVLKGKSGAQLGCFVRRLRLEGHFGAVVGKIFNALPGITDIFLKLPSYARENVSGLLKGLPNLNPTRVIFEYAHSSTWKNSDLMIEALCNALQNWKTLTTFELHVSIGGNLLVTKGLLRIAKALSAAPALLRTIASFDKLWRASGSFPTVVDIVKQIRENSSLKSLKVLLPSQQELDDTMEGLLGDSCVKFTQFPIKILDKEARVPELTDDILEKIIHFDLRSQVYRILFEQCPAEVHNRRLLDLMTVSKRFYKITRTMPRRLIDASDPKDLFAIAARLKKFYRPSVETVILPHVGRWEEIYSKSPITESAIRLLGILTKVKEISLSTDNIRVIRPTPVKLGLRWLQLKISGGCFDQSVFLQFDNLTSLILGHHRARDASISVRQYKKHRICFSKVKFVKIIDTCNRGSLQLIQACDFPAAQSLELKLPDCMLSGSELKKTETISFPTFAQLQIINIDGLIQGMYTMFMKAGNYNIEKLVISTYYQSPPPRPNSPFQDMIQTFDNIDFNKLNKLKEVQMTNIDEWPYQDRDLKNYDWQDRVQGLVEAYGFRLLDKSWNPWKPRLHHTKAKRTKAKH